MRTKLDLRPVEDFFLNEVGPEFMIPALLEIEERYLTYILRDAERTGGDGADEQLYYLRSLRKALQRVLE